MSLMVRILKEDKNLGLEVGDIFEAQYYMYDSEKVELIRRGSDGFEPCCTEYKYNLEII